jgi:multidrug resistance efflux pump
LLGKDQTNLQRYQTLVAQNSIARQQAEDQKYIVDQDQANIRLDQALIDGAQHNLDNSVVTAPTDGYVTNLALRKGARVNGQSPVMAFIDTADTIFGVEIPQIYARYIAVGQRVEVTFKFFPGMVYTGRVEAVLQAIATGQSQVGGLAVAPTAIETAPFVVRFKLDDREAAQRLPAGSTGLAAVFTDRVEASHLIRQVVLRQTAILNYVNPF